MHRNTFFSSQQSNPIVIIILLLGYSVTMAHSQQLPNLTAITWDHAVNSQELLNKALESDVQFIEADIVLGTLFDDPSEFLQPVMGHPPNTVSDITLSSFLNQVLDYNVMHKDAQKGVKLDFKSIEVFKGSEELLTKLWPQMTYPVWINADILAGPVNNTETVPVNPVQFFEIAKKLPNAVLSIGWTTLWSANHTEGDYNKDHIDKMLNAISDNNINGSQHDITFPVRAGIAANSLDNLNDLLGAVNATNNSTLTVWSSPNDYVNISALRNVIFAIGLDRVYLDVPEEVSSKLELDKSSANTHITSGVIKLAFVAAISIIFGHIFMYF